MVRDRYQHVRIAQAEAHRVGHIPRRAVLQVVGPRRRVRASLERRRRVLVAVLSLDVVPHRLRVLDPLVDVVFDGPVVGPPRGSRPACWRRQVSKGKCGGGGASYR